MSFGYEVNIRGVATRLDASYENVVQAGVLTVTLSPGYHHVNMAAYANPGLLCAVRHPGCSLSFLGYVYSGGSRAGINLYTPSGGTFYFTCYVPFYPINTATFGVVIYDGSGVMRFHSHHTYMDVATTGTVSLGINAGSGSYILSNAAYLSFDYTYNRSKSISTAGLVTYELWCWAYKNITCVHQDVHGRLSQVSVNLLNRHLVSYVSYIGIGSHDPTPERYDIYKKSNPATSTFAGTTIVTRV